MTGHNSHTRIMLDMHLVLRMILYNSEKYPIHVSFNFLMINSSVYTLKFAEFYHLTRKLLAKYLYFVIMLGCTTL